WRVIDKTSLIDYLEDHHAEAGGGMNFKAVTWYGALEELERTCTLGGPKTPALCKNKWAKLKETYLIVIALQKASGFSWSDEKGANVDKSNKSVWDVYIRVLTVITHQQHPNAKPFHNKGWTHFYGVQSLMSLTAKGTHM
ncbi:hypothetical protein JAAARDRAFT_82614, partial [Jaapia argillacea MUCL 33604]